MTPNPSKGDDPACPRPDRLTAYRKGLLPENDRREVASHLATCSSCRLSGEGSPRTEHSHSARTETIDFPSQPFAPEGERPHHENGTPAKPPLPEKLGQYEVRGVIGRGGMGVVRKGWHARLKRPVAIKFLHPGRCSESGIGRFVREMEVIGRLDHPNIVRALDADEKDGHHYLVMEFLDGLTLGELVACTGPLPVAAACEVIRQAAVGMQYVHERNLVHRDIKPSNLLLTTDGTVKILDLGLALLRWPNPLDERLTDQDEVMGTADYMSPEQGASSRDADIRSDVYSLGCTLYMLLSGAPPFAGPAYHSLYQKIEAHTRESVPSLRSRRPDLNVEVARIVGRMLAKAPADRYATPQAVADALAPFARRDELAGLLQRATGGASRNPGCGSSTTPESPPGKRLWPVAAACSGLLVLVGLAVWIFGTPGSPVIAPPAREPLKPDVVHEMLAREPKEILFPEKDSRKRFDADRREVWVDTNGTALFGLGETDADDFEIEVFVHQTLWTGGFGIFFGYRETEGDEGSFARFHLVEMNTISNAAPLPLYRLDYLRCRRKPGKKIDCLDVGTDDIPTPGPVPFPLKVTVAKGRLQKVTWGKKELPGLTFGRPGPRTDRVDCKGAFGLFAHSRAITFRDARFLYREGKPDVQP